MKLLIMVMMTNWPACLSSGLVLKIAELRRASLLIDGKASFCILQFTFLRSFMLIGCWHQSRPIKTKQINLNFCQNLAASWFLTVSVSQPLSSSWEIMTLQHSQQSSFRKKPNYHQTCQHCQQMSTTINSCQQRLCIETIARYSLPERV